MNLSAATEEFMIDQQVRGNTARTLGYYRQSLGVFAEFAQAEQNRTFSAAAPLTDITLPLCKRYYLHLAQKGIATTTAQTYIRALRAFLSWCYSEGYIAENIPARLKLPKAQRKTIDVLTDEEIRRLFACFDLRTMTGARNYAICALMIDSGLRLNEVVTLEAGAVHVAEGYAIVNGKGNKQRMVPLGLHSRRALGRYVARVPFHLEGKTGLFLQDKLIPIKQSTIEQLFRVLKARAGIPRLRPHLLRHSFATRYLQAGGDVYSLQQILGHTSLDMVRRYVHLIPQETIVCFPQFSPLDTLAQKQRKP